MSSNNNKSRRGGNTASKVIWQGVIIRRERDARALMLGASDGDRVGRGFFIGLVQWLKKHRRVPARKAPLCLACEHVFGRGAELPGTFLMTFSEDPRVKQVVLSGVCERCAKRSDPELLSTAAKQMCKLLDGEVIGIDFQQYSGQPETTH